MPASESERFYADLPPLTEFEGFAEFDSYRPVPEDWVVLAGDIQGSTGAIAAGRYKDVNMVGAAVITAVVNACRGVDLPYVFGGDGGAVVVPGNRAAAGGAALKQLRAHARRVFGLSLRAAAVPVRRLRAEGCDVRVRRLALNGANHLALFTGGGIERAEEILKSGPGDPDLLAPGPGEPAPDLDGLSCRWEPLAAAQGSMIALMVRPVGDETEGYRAILARLKSILSSLPDHAPVSARTLRFRWPPRGALAEARVRARGGSIVGPLAWVVGTSLGQLWAHRFGTRFGPYAARRYLAELGAQTDFRKFDGCLRAVLDCTEKQVEEIEAWLEAEHRAGRLVYGLHSDRTALMTCLVFSLERSEHVHFVDAAGGGFARAAADFKRRAGALPAPAG